MHTPSDWRRWRCCCDHADGNASCSGPGSTHRCWPTRWPAPPGGGRAGVPVGQRPTPYRRLPRRRAEPGSRAVLRGERVQRRRTPATRNIPRDGHRQSQPDTDQHRDRAPEQNSRSPAERTRPGARPEPADPAGIPARTSGKSSKAALRASAAPRRPGHLPNQGTGLFRSASRVRCSWCVRGVTAMQAA